ncbi:MAG: hypothetical protein ACH34U_09480 [Cyanobium sp.]|jgi:hypothetical protein
MESQLEMVPRSGMPMHAYFLGPRLQPLRRQSLLIAGLLLSVALAQPLQAASALLESVKQNPALAKSLCAQFKQLNAAGRSATAPDSIAMVASSQGLSKLDAEVLATYVIGLHCPDVR